MTTVNIVYDMKEIVKRVNPKSYYHKENFFFFSLLYLCRKMVVNLFLVIILFHNMRKSDHLAVYLNLIQWCMSIISQQNWNKIK